jgi:guanine nucleotide-binding protein subunit beta-2-like 1 protein
MSNKYFEYLGYLEGHNGHVTSLDVGQTADGSPLLISGGRDKNAIVWKLDLDAQRNVGDDGRTVETCVGKPYKSLHGHNHFVSCIGMHSSNKHFFTGSWDKTLRLWDLTKFTTHQRFQGHTKDVLSLGLTCQDRLLVSGSMDNTVRVWDLNANVQHTIEEFTGWVSCIRRINSGKDSNLAIGSWDNTVGVYDGEYSRNRTISNSDNAVTCMDVDSTGNFLFVGSKNGLINLWDISEESEFSKKTIDTNSTLHSVSYVDQWVQYVFAGTDKGLGIYDLTSGKALSEFNFGSRSACLSLAWDAARNHIFAGFADGRIRVFRSAE